MDAKSNRTLTTSHYKVFLAKTTKIPRPRPEFPTLNQNEIYTGVFLLSDNFHYKY